jgi:hypothetical protein
MAPPSEISRGGSATEKRPEIQSTPAINKATVEAAPGGFSFLRAMKMRGLKGRGGASAPPPAVSNVSNGRSIDRKDNNELKVAQTNDSGDGPRGIGEVDALHEVRSDDELLGGEGNSAPHRAGTQGAGNNGADGEDAPRGRVYKVYKRRWFGLVQLVLLNIIVSWDVSSPYKVQPASNRTLMQGSVALIFGQLNYNVSILQCIPIRYQLAEHSLHVRVLRCNTTRDLHTASWGPKTVHYHRLNPHLVGQLD